MTKKTITITIKDNIDDKAALGYVLRVIAGGRISNGGKSYCLCTTFGDRIVVFANKRKNDSFIVCQFLLNTSKN